MLRILICPLNWGLGHVTRCRPIIDLLTSRGHEVHLAGDGPSLQILKTNYPNHQVHKLAPLNISYGSNFWTRLMIQVPALIQWMIKDKIRVRQLHRLFHFDVIISDSRPGCILNSTITIFLINQPSPIIPFWGIRWLIKQVLRKGFKQFDRIWIPDLQGEASLSGKLIELPFSIRVRRIGFLSALEKYNTMETPEKRGRILAIVSGPEPTRSDFERDLRQKLENQDAFIAGGRPDVFTDSAGYSSFLDAPELAKQISQAEYIICRAGYSTLMDLAAYRKKLILVPTPGQTEQEYLARLLQDKNQGTIWNIHQKSWETVQSETDGKLHFHSQNDPTLLMHAVKEMEQLAQKSAVSRKKEN